MQLSLAQATTYAQRVLIALDVPEDIACDVAEHLVEADRVGYASHGLSILPHYRRMLNEGLARAEGRPEKINDHGPLLAYDGHHGLGQHVGKIVMQAAIARAQQQGLCLLTLRQSHHLGRIGHYGEMAAAQELIFLAFTNVINRAATVAPFGGAQARLTTNPLCFAGPMPGQRPPFIVDMATSAISVNKARVLATTGIAAPPGALIDAHGNPTTDPNTLFSDPPGALLPFGGHKGYAMGLVAELLAGVLSGGGTLQAEQAHQGAATNNLFALVLNPHIHFNADWRSAEVGAFIDYLHSCPPQPGVDRVQYPGEYEAYHREKNAHTIQIDNSIWAALQQLAAELDLPQALPAH